MIIKSMGNVAVPSAIDVGSIQEAIEDGTNGFVVPQEDFRAMAEKAEFLINNEDDYVGMQKQALRTIREQFSKQHLKDRVEKYISKLKDFYMNASGKSDGKYS